MKFQQWDGTQWTVLTDWIAPDQALVRPLVEASAAKYAQEKGITPRTARRRVASSVQGSLSLPPESDYDSLSYTFPYCARVLQLLRYEIDRMDL